MQLNPDRAELVSAATDLLLAVLACVGAAHVARRDWRLTFSMLAVTSALGAVVHGGAWSESTQELLWWPLDFLLAGALACFAAVALHDAMGLAFVRRARVPLLALAMLAAGISRSFPDTLLPFLLFEASILISAGSIWLARARSAGMAGADRLAAGCAVALLAGGIAASGVRVELAWPLDANSLFHLVQAIALLLWISGARAEASVGVARE